MLIADRCRWRLPASTLGVVLAGQTFFSLRLRRIRQCAEPVSQTRDRVDSSRSRSLAGGSV
eukprot:6221090-Prymnesium_polylepis.1